MVLDTLAAGRGYKETWQQGQMAFMAAGMVASGASAFLDPVGTYLSFSTALQVAAVIYFVFGAQMFLVPAFFLAENFEGFPTAGQAHYFLLFFMRMFGLLIITTAAVLWCLKDQLVLFKIFAFFNCIQIFQGPGKAIQMFDVTAKHIVPVILLPAVGFVFAATLL